MTLQAIGDGVITTNADGRVVWLNPVAERMTGWTSSEAAGQHMEDIFAIVNTKTRTPVANPVYSCLQQAGAGAATVDADTILIRRDGVEFGIEDWAATILDDNGKLVGAVLVFRDVTEQNLHAQAMSNAKLELRIKDEFLSHVSTNYDHRSHPSIPSAPLPRMVWSDQLQQNSRSFSGSS